MFSPTTETTTSTPAIKYNASTNLKDRMSVGESVVVTLVTAKLPLRAYSDGTLLLMVMQ